LSGSDQEKFAYVLIKGTFFDSTTMIDNMMINGTDNATFLENKGFFEGVGVGTPASILAPFSRSVYTADQTQELFYNKPGSVYGKNWYLLAPVPGDYLSRYGRRLYNNPFENVKFTYLMTANRAGTNKVTRIPITAPTPNQASNQVNETFYNQPNNKFGKLWYQLAPYYAQSSWVYENDSDPFELITVGSRVGFKASGDPYELVQFLLIPNTLRDTNPIADNKGNFVDKRLDETKTIPQVAKFDALRVMGLEPINKTSSIINLAKYTPLRSTDYTYYNKYDWFSISPRSQVAKQALGIGDGSPYIIDTFLFGDVFTYNENKFLSSINVTVGTQGPLGPIYGTVNLPPVSSNSSSIQGTNTTGNLVRYSEQLEQSSVWSTTQGNVSITANYGLGNPDPRGTSTADQAQINLFNSNLIQTLSSTITSGSVVRFTFWAKFGSNSNAVFFGFFIHFLIRHRRLSIQANVALIIFIFISI
jgi:hypothetical protein